MDISDDELVRASRPLAKAAVIAEGVVIFSVIIGVVTGTLLVAETKPVSNVGGAPTHHPYVGAGIATIALSLVLGLVFWCLMRASYLLASDIVARRGAHQSDSAV